MFILEPVSMVANTSCHNKELLKAAGVDDSSQILSYVQFPTAFRNPLQMATFQKLCFDTINPLNTK